MNLNDMARDAFENSKAKGFWDKQADWANPDLLDENRLVEAIPEKLCLIHSEVSEALEVVRKPYALMQRAPLPHGEKPEGFASELADIIIRVGDLAHACNINLDMAVKEKMTYNATREKMHGKRF